MDSDLLGYLLWEYDRLQVMTMLRSAQFAYGHSDNSEEMSKGAASANFSFAVIYGDSVGSNCTLCVDGKKLYLNVTQRF